MTTPAAVRSIVREVLGPRLDGVSDETRFVDLAMDSMDVVELALELQDRLDVVLRSEDLSHSATVGQLVQRVVEASR